MKLSTAFKISGFCLFALAAEAVIAYLIFSNYAFSLAETGQYSMPEAYATGPMATHGEGVLWRFRRNHRHRHRGPDRIPALFDFPTAVQGPLNTNRPAKTSVENQSAKPVKYIV